MSRRLIIAILLVLIVGVVGGTAALVVTRLNSTDSPPSAQQPGGQLQESQTGSQQVADPTGDADSDGLSNADERLWGTNPNNPDTDGDGFKDGEEVAAGRNPTIPAPNDILPPGFTPGRDLAPLESAPSAPIAVDQFFSSNLDLSGGKEDLTAKFKSKFKEEDRTPEAVAQFVDEQKIVTQLPAPAKKSVLLQKSDSAAALAEYLAVSGHLGAFSNPTLLDEAVDNLLEGGDPSNIRGLALAIRIHQETLIETPVPPSAENYHRLLLGYTELQAATYDQIAKYSDDPVKGLVGIRQLEENNEFYLPLMEQELARLHQLGG